MERIENKEGITVRQLKEIIKDWPEEDVLGEETEVYVMNWEINTSRPVTEITPLNCREDMKGNKSADLLID